jgi:predicted RNA-binding Zn-ribbon protein involved in translation (DUF1610 family)
MALSTSSSGWLERIAAHTSVCVLTVLYPELRLARNDRDRILAASGLGRFMVSHPRLSTLGMVLFPLAAVAVGILGGREALRAAASLSPLLQTLVSIVGFLIGLAAPFIAVYLLSRRSKRQIHLYLLRGLDAPICPSCGYSMHGHSPAQPVTCPECGNEVAVELPDRLWTSRTCRLKNLVRDPEPPTGFVSAKGAARPAGKGPDVLDQYPRRGPPR